MKIIVAHPQQQHSYRLATALKRRGILGAYCTTVYYRKNSLTSIVASVLPDKWKTKATGRHCDELDSKEVIQYCELGGLFVLLARNLPMFRKLYGPVRRYVEDRFAVKVANLAKNIDADAVVGYDGVSARLFEEIRIKSPKTKCIADMSAANALFLRDIYEKDVELKPEYSESLHGWDRIWNPVDVERTKRELLAADGFLCGSSFVLNSLKYSGIEEKACVVCHYGVDITAFPYVEKSAKGQEEPLVFIYLGQVSEHKGISYLFEAFEGIGESEAVLQCIGAVNLPDSIQNALPSNIELLGMKLHNEIADLLSNADVMLFPSLGDGFPLSVMEGFSIGLPVVCTDNTGAADCIDEGENGFVVPTQDASAIREKIDWFLDNRSLIPQMSKKAREQVLGLTWEAYYCNVADAVEKLIGRANEC